VKNNSIIVPPVLCVCEREKGCLFLGEAPRLREFESKELGRTFWPREVAENCIMSFVLRALLA